MHCSHMIYFQRGIYIALEYMRSSQIKYFKQIMYVGQEHIHYCHMNWFKLSYGRYMMVSIIYIFLILIISNNSYLLVKNSCTFLFHTKYISW